jgi:hypothetical protein
MMHGHTQIKFVSYGLHEFYDYKKRVILKAHKYKVKAA